MPALAVLAALTAWLWPVGVGGRMPVGGDVTQFSIGLMAVLGRALRAGRLPLWNDLWGFGFPGLAESQMGVYYPPHLLLYRVLSTEAAYTTSLVLHTYWAGLGAFWAARRFGVSPWGAALSGFAWAASGTFLIHLPHQWGYTTGSWMPWAIGLGWMLATGAGGLATACLLAAVLAMQVLPGHFQFAFHTQVALALLALWGLAARPRGLRPAAGSAALIAGAIAAVLPLDAAQLWPTLQLARSAETQRTAEYLSAFPATPIHLASYIAPDLFYVSPLWRPLAWDPFHAMPEEHRPYIGLVPLMLALGAIRRGWRGDRATGALTWLAVASLSLSLGSYLPGFSWLIRLPGFSFFRAPARWGLLTQLALAILAGQGFDRWRDWPNVGRAALRFAVVATLVPMLLVGLVEGAFRSTDRPGESALSTAYESGRRLLPWFGDPTFWEVMAQARRPPSDPLIVTNLLRRGIEPRAMGRMRLDRERFSIYRDELLGTAARLGLLVLFAVPLARRARWAGGLLLLFVAADLLEFSTRRAVGTAPIRPLVEQSAVLGRLAREGPTGLRTIDGLRNLPMIAGVAPVAAYRTLDRPAMPGLIALASGWIDAPATQEAVREAMRALGATIRVLDPVFEGSQGSTDAIRDPALGSWLYGTWGAANPNFRVWRPAPPGRVAPRAFFVRDELPETTNPDDVLAILRAAQPLEFAASSPETFEVRGRVEGPGTGTVVVSVLDDAEWRVTGGLDPRPMRAFGARGAGAWQAVRVATGGPIALRWHYRGDAARAGQIVSAVAWSAWSAAFAFSAWWGRRKRVGWR